LANTLLTHLNKQNYALLREHVTPGSPQAQALLGGLQERLSGAGLPDAESAALKQVYGLLMREAEVLTLNTLFHVLALTFLLALLLMPWVRKVSAPSSEAVGGH
jgi:DHA2 family multidrug resistance protein